ncbi:MAG: EamA family transporter [Treponema sp.]
MCSLENKKSDLKYTAAVILSGVLWGIISLFLKALTSCGFNSIQIMVIRAVLSCVILFFVLFFKDKSLLKIQVKDLWMFIGTGIVSLTLFSLCYFTTILESGASVAVVLLYTSPIFVLLISALLFKEKITLVKVLALVLTFCGCVLVAGLVGGTHSVSVKGFVVGLCSGLGYALYSIFSRFALKKYKPITITFYTFLFSGISIIPFCNLSEMISNFTPGIILPSFAISILCTVLPYILYTYGLSGIENSKAAILVTVEPLVGTLIGIFLYGEGHNALKLCGIAMIFVSIVLCGIKGKEKE